MTVIIAGCGDLGTAVGLRFAELGQHVVGMRRSPEKLLAPIEGWSVDLTQPLPALPATTDTVIVPVAADRRTPDAYRSAYIDTVMNLVGALERDGLHPRRFLFVSSTAVYGVDDGSWIDEETEAVAASETGAIIREAERALHQRMPSAIVLRLGGLYGPGRGRLIRSVSDGTATIAQHTQFTNRIHRDDAADAIVHLTTDVADPAPVYLGVDQEPTDRGEVLTFLASELAAPMPPVSVNETQRGMGKRCSSALLAATGFDFTYPTYREGYRALLDGVGVSYRD